MSRALGLGMRLERMHMQEEDEKSRLCQAGRYKVIDDEEDEFCDLQPGFRVLGEQEEEESEEENEDDVIEENIPMKR